MHRRVEGRGGDARADRRAGAGPDECAEDPQPHPVRPGPVGDHAPPNGGATPAARPGPLHPTRHATAAKAPKEAPGVRFGPGEPPPTAAWRPP